VTVARNELGERPGDGRFSSMGESMNVSSFSGIMMFGKREVGLGGIDIDLSLAGEEERNRTLC
jgi:hypothetical protein